MEKDTSVADRLARMKVKSVSFFSLLLFFSFFITTLFTYFIRSLLGYINPKTLENPNSQFYLYSKVKIFH